MTSVQTSPDQLEHHGAPGTTMLDSAELYRQTQEAGVETEPLPLETYADTANQIEVARSYYRDKKDMPLGEQLVNLRGVYVEDEPDERLQRFSRVMIEAPLQAKREVKMKQLRDERRAGSITPERRTMLKDIKLAATEYDHALRDTMMDGRASFDRPTLTAWLTAAAGGDHVDPRWARNTMAGITGEIAMYEALKDMPELTNVAFTDAKTDARQGIDITASHGDQPLGFDAKFDGAMPTKKDWRERTGPPMLVVTMGVGDESIDDMSLSQKGHRRLTTDLRTAIGL
jgi:hypothetical protein